MNRIISALFSIHFLSVICVAQWFQLNSGTTNNLYSLFFIDANTGYCSGVNIILKTTNGGMNWMNSYSGSTTFSSIFFTNTDVGYTVSYSGNIFKTTNGGMNWVNVFTASGTYLLCVYFVDQNTGYAVGGGVVILKTTNAGTNWLNLTPPINNFLYAVFFTDANNGIVTRGGDPGAIYKTTNGGMNWLYVGSGFAMGSIDFVNSSTGFITGINGRIYKTFNGGSSWTEQFIGFPGSVNSVHFASPSTGYVVGNGDGIAKTTDGGISWTTQTGLINSYYLSVRFPNVNTGYIAGYYGVILKTTNGGITSLIPVSNETPEDFRLFQNYPNPFNGATKINFDLPKSTFVRLTVYDGSGRVIEKLIDEYISAGSYSMKWNADDYASGIYFCRLQSDEMTESVKMLLIK